jgi:hypothetical protein
LADHIYFDTVAFREIGNAFNKTQLAKGLRDKILISPITLYEVWSQLTIQNAQQVLQQFHAVRNWTSPERTGLLAWPDGMLFQIWFEKPNPDDEFTKRIEKAFNVCLAVESVEPLHEEARKFKDVMDRGKVETAQNFKRLLEFARKTPLSDEEFSNAWFRGIANRVKADPNSRVVSQIVSKLSAHHEFEHSKLNIATKNTNYNVEKHINDLFDAEQLIYLADPTLRFLTCDHGIRNLVNRSSQAERIVTVSPDLLRDAVNVERLLRELA